MCVCVCVSRLDRTVILLLIKYLGKAMLTSSLLSGRKSERNTRGCRNQPTRPGFLKVEDTNTSS